MEKIEAWQIPETIPKKKRTKKTDQKPAPFCKCARSGTKSITIAVIINVDTILSVYEYFQP